MTEHVTMKNATVDFWISDRGQLTVEVTSDNKNRCIIMDVKKVLGGKIPWMSMGGELRE